MNPINEKEHNEILAEYDALIKIAWGEIKGPGLSIKCDPALARNLEWLRDSYLSLWELSKNK